MDQFMHKIQTCFWICTTKLIENSQLTFDPRASASKAQHNSKANCSKSSSTTASKQ